MTFSDIFKSSLLENVTEFSVVDTLIGLLFGLNTMKRKCWKTCG